METRVNFERPAGQTADTARCNLIVQVLALVFYATWVIWVGMHHEAWFDEMQAWLLARDNTLVTLIGTYARYEGTPGLWHAILWLAIHTGLPFGAIWVLSAGFAIVAAALVLWRAPFPLPLRVGLLATWYFGYQYSVVARGYCLDLMLLPMAAILFADRVRWPLGYAVVIGIIANINAFSFLASGLLGLELLVRLALARRLGDRRALAALALAGGFGLFAMWTAWQPADNGFMAQVTRMNPVGSAVVFVANALFDRVTPWSTVRQTGVDVVLGMALSAAFLALIVRLVLAGRDRALMLAMPISLIVFSGAVLASSWHGGVLFTVLLFVLWTQWANPVDRPTRHLLFGALALLEFGQGMQTVHSGLYDVSHAYSAGHPAADAIMAWRADHPGAGISAFGGQSFETQPWLPRNVFDNYHGGAPHPQFVRWNSDETWHALPHPQEWNALLATHPDAILAAMVWLPAPVKADPAGQACQAGYSVAHRFPAAMQWRGLSIDNTLFLLERAKNGSCFRS